jgi:asparaginyl-tRNA synthetase
VQTHPPIITSSDCEGAGEVFSVANSASNNDPRGETFFNTPKYLTVSSQLHLEALAQSVGSVWTLAPTFRAEQSDTPRHLSEFYMLEAETIFAEELNDIMNIAERLLQSVAHRLYDSRIGEELLSIADSKTHRPTSENIISSDLLQSRWLRLKDGSWPRIKYADAVELLNGAAVERKVHFKFRPEPGKNLQAEHEKYIAQTVGNGGPVFITDYPRDIKAFYMPLSPSQPSDTSSRGLTVSCFDLVVPEFCEIIGGSMREHRLDRLLASMDHHGLLKPRDTEEAGDPLESAQLARVPANLQWYIDLRKWGSVPHGGFGLGFDRLLCYLAGVASIRDMVTFPRWYGRCDC